MAATRLAAPRPRPAHPLADAGSEANLPDAAECRYGPQMTAASRVPGLPSDTPASEVPPAPTEPKSLQHQPPWHPPYSRPANDCCYCGDEGVSQSVRPNWFFDPGTAGHTPHDAPGRVAVEASSIGANEDRPAEAFADGEVDRSRRARGQGDRHYLASLSQHCQGPVATFEPERLDVSADGFGDSETVEGQERDEGVLRWCSQPGGDQESTHFVAVKPNSMGLVIKAGPAHMDCWRCRHEALFFGVAVKAGHCVQPAGDSGPSSAGLFEVTGVELYVRATDREKLQPMPLAPRNELAQVQRVRVRGSALGNRLGTLRGQPARHL